MKSFSIPSFLSACRRLIRRGVPAMVGVLLMLPLPVGAEIPEWWATRGVFKPGPVVVDDYLALNQGQLKNFVRAAVDEMNAKLPGGAGTTLTTLLATWRANAAAGTTDDFAVANIGQLKAMGKLVRSRLGLATPGTTADATDDDDFAPANVGQAKAVFAFEIEPPFVDADEDGMDDVWEVNTFGTLNHHQFNDTDGDGVSDLDEFLAGTDPRNWRSHPGAADEAIVMLSVYTPVVK